ncbi:DgyrCDS585 [Dimorphilus gyrociliatus]|uniref:DgyrCDS585 n=1 Tax=Dimorphilus gyrociliatus TaxID=2664684 RepID=A0A7I8V525_9ANNE|nr:DgyrCDS585 [Dimorphilus gyrociliatus]
MLVIDLRIVNVGLKEFINVFLLSTQPPKLVSGAEICSRHLPEGESYAEWEGKVADGEPEQRCRITIVVEKREFDKRDDESESRGRRDESTSTNRTASKEETILCRTPNGFNATFNVILNHLRASGKTPNEYVISESIFGGEFKCQSTIVLGATCSFKCHNSYRLPPMRRKQLTLRCEIALGKPTLVLEGPVSNLLEKSYRECSPSPRTCQTIKGIEKGKMFGKGGNNGKFGETISIRCDPGYIIPGFKNLSQATLICSDYEFKKSFSDKKITSNTLQWRIVEKGNVPFDEMPNRIFRCAGQFSPFVENCKGHEPDLDEKPPGELEERFHFVRASKSKFPIEIDMKRAGWYPRFLSDGKEVISNLQKKNFKTLIIKEPNEIYRLNFSASNPRYPHYSAHCLIAVMGFSQCSKREIYESYLKFLKSKTWKFYCESALINKDSRPISRPNRTCTFQCRNHRQVAHEFRSIGKNLICENYENWYGLDETTFMCVVDGSFLSFDNQLNSYECSNIRRLWRMDILLFKRNRNDFSSSHTVSPVYLKLRDELQSIYDSKADEFYYDLFRINDNGTRRLRRRLLYTRSGCSHPGLAENYESHYCIGCLRGYMMSKDGDECIPCPKHHYQDEIEQSDCKPCPKGQHQPNQGSSFCENCPGNNCSNPKAKRKSENDGIVVKVTTICSIIETWAKTGLQRFSIVATVQYEPSRLTGLKQSKDSSTSYLKKAINTFKSIIKQRGIKFITTKLLTDADKANVLSYHMRISANNKFVVDCPKGMNLLQDGFCLLGEKIGGRDYDEGREELKGE